MRIFLPACSSRSARRPHLLPSVRTEFTIPLHDLHWAQPFRRWQPVGGLSHRARGQMAGRDSARQFDFAAGPPQRALAPGNQQSQLSWSLPLEHIARAKSIANFAFSSSSWWSQSLRCSRSRSRKRCTFSLSSDRTFRPDQKPKVNVYAHNVDVLEFRVHKVQDPAAFFAKLDDLHEFGVRHYSPREGLISAPGWRSSTTGRGAAGAGYVTLPRPVFR